MKIPTYDSQISVPGRVVYQDVVKPKMGRDLDGLIKGLDSIQVHEERKRKEDTAMHDYLLSNRANMELHEFGATLQDEIQSGGSYGDAEAKYKKKYNDITTKYAPQFMDEKNRVEGVTGWQRAGLENTLRLRDSVRARQKSDAVGAAANQASLLDQKWLDADEGQRAEIAKQYARVYGGLAGVGAISSGEGQARTREALSRAETNRIRMLAADDPRTAMEELKKSKGLFEADTYVSLYGPIKNEVDALGSLESATLKFDSAPNSLSQTEADIIYSSSFSNPDMSPIEREAGTIAFVNRVGKVPSAIQNQAAVYLGTFNQPLSPQDAATAVSAARIVDQVSQNSNMISADSRFSEDVQTKAALIVSRAQAGMDETTAANSVLSTLSNKDNADVYKAARSNAVSKLADGSVSLPYSGSDEAAGQIRPQFIDAYSRYKFNGSSDKEAASLAKKDIKNRYKKFNDIVVDSPPQSMTGYSEKSWINAAEEQAKTIAPDALKYGGKIIVQADYETKRLKANGAGPNDLTFPVQIYLGKNNYFPIMKPDGQPLRIKADPELMKTETPDLFGSESEDGFGGFLFK